MAEKPVVDLEAIRKQVGQLSNEDLQKKFLALRVRQKVQIEKGKSRSKDYAARQREREKQIKEEMNARGLLAQAEETATELADEKIEELIEKGEIARPADEADTE